MNIFLKCALGLALCLLVVNTYVLLKPSSKTLGGVTGLSSLTLTNDLIVTGTSTFRGPTYMPSTAFSSAGFVSYDRITTKSLTVTSSADLQGTVTMTTSTFWTVTSTGPVIHANNKCYRLDINSSESFVTSTVGCPL